MENTNNLQESNPSVPKRLPRSQKKRLKREKKRLGRRLKRSEVKRRRKSVIRAERDKFLSSLSPDERESYIYNLRVTNYEKSVNLNNFLETAYGEGLPICIDCSFGDDMNSKEIRSLAKQISLCYNLIKKYKTPIRLTLTSFSQSSTLYDDCQLFGFNNWKVHVHDSEYWHLFDKDNIVVLSPDATEYLEELSDDKVYVIGGLVDTNVKKNKMLNKAISHNITAKKLPIKKYVPSCKKTVLNVSTVFEILCIRLSSLSWQEAFTRCLPSRMYKRAYLYCSNAPIPISHEEQAETNKDESPINEPKDDVDENKKIDESIKNYPGNKVSYCVHCKGKTFLNQESVEKHLASKNHLKNVKKTKKNDEKMEEAKIRFIKRIAEVDKRLSQYSK